MKKLKTRTQNGAQLVLSCLGAMLLLGALFALLQHSPPEAHASPTAPIDPPTGYPKFNQSTTSVTPTLANSGGVTLYYTLEVVNTGAYTAAGMTMTDYLPAGTSYNDDFSSNVSGTLTVLGDALTWVGDVGFDATALFTFSLTVDPLYSGTIENVAVVSHPLALDPFTMTAETTVTDEPILAIEKTSAPPKPGPNGVIEYALTVTNLGQPAVGEPITITDQVPVSTTLLDIGSGGFTGPFSDVVTWTQPITLEIGQSTTPFTFRVRVHDVPSGTVIVNDLYRVASPAAGIRYGDPYTVTVIHPILSLSKEISPDPPGSNREALYTLLLFNSGSLATDLVITDAVPAGTTYLTGGIESGGVVSWTLDSLNTGERAEFTYTVWISDVADVTVVNDDYHACSAEGVCVAGDALTSVVEGPTFETFVYLDPIAKKPGGGGGPVTPTLIVRNTGPGNAIDAQAMLYFRRISVNANDLYVDPPEGTAPPFPPGPACGDKCVSYVWIGPVDVGDVFTFTTLVGQSTIGGEEGTKYTATIVITDAMTGYVTDPVTGTASGKVTHYANLVPTKRAHQPVVGPGQLLTYTIRVWNSALTTDEPPVLTDVVPLSTTLVAISHDGISQTMTSTISTTRTLISWTLPTMGTGETLYRSFAVRVDEDLISGTRIFNDDYGTTWYESEITETNPYLHNQGVPVTVTVQEVGLIHSYKTVTPTLAAPGSDVVLTYALHIVNSSPLSLTGVTIYDWLPWQDSTYQRDAVASAGTIVSDIVSFEWTGDVGALSEEVVTLTVRVDPGFSGPITNTAIISHADLDEEVVAHAVAYVTDLPVLHIHKSAAPSPVQQGEELKYTIRVTNQGQQATGLLISDTIPANTTYVPGSASGSGQLVGDEVQWERSVLDTGEAREFTFRVVVDGAAHIVNERYAVVCAEGVTAVGAPVATQVGDGSGFIYLPLVLRNH